MIRLHGGPRSRAIRPLWLLEELGVPYECVKTDFAAGATRTPEFLAINPNGHVPALEDGDVKIFESLAINLYLAEKYKSALFPATPEGRGRMLQWAFFTANDVEPPMITMFQNRVLFPPEKRNAALGDAAEAQLLGKLAILEGHLSKHPHFGGDTWDMADFMVASVVYTLTAIKYNLAKFPKLSAWLMASIERPAAKEARKLRE